MRKILIPLTRNPISLVGSAMMLISAILFASLLLIELLGAEGNPYIGIVTYLILPAGALLGFILVLWGIRREQRLAPEAAFPVIDLNSEATRKRLMVLVLVVTSGAVILTAAMSQGVHVMESTSFCGETCHSVMSPEYIAYQRSPHARVACVECHVGSGTSWFVRSKLSGAWQLVSTAFDLYDRPIPTPVHHLRPSEGTCEECHWPEKFYGTRAKMITRFTDDEANSETKTILLLKIGGDDFGGSQGIHWHMDPEVEIRYRSDEKRHTMYEVELKVGDEPVKRFVKQTIREENPEPMDWRVMDCIDCHNRPTHVYYSAEQAVDLALERDFIARDLPYVRREGLKAVRAEYASHEEAELGIAAAIDSFYRAEYPGLASSRADDIQEAGRVLGRLYANNVFPSMRIEWDTYPDFSGHYNSLGCNRCHAGDHATEDGDVIDSDCSICHTIVAWDEASPQILELIPE